MAEVDIGQHCSKPDCKQLDFLPVTCTRCGLVFCKEHSFSDYHDCTHEKEDYADRKDYTGPKSLQCDFSGCKHRELTPVICEFCRMNFCLHHRHGSDHGCTKMPVYESRKSKTAQHVQEILQKQAATNPAIKGPKRKMTQKAKATAAKVSLMKLKLKAEGKSEIPETERIYLQVFLPKTCQSKTKPLFFSKVWSIGRIIDLVAERVGLKNENNVTGARKLRLFDRSDGQILHTDKPMEYFVSGKVIFNGGDVVLEYVESDAEFLESYAEYAL